MCEEEKKCIDELIENIYQFQSNIDSEYKNLNLKRTHVKDLSIYEIINYRNYLIENIVLINGIVDSFISKSTSNLHIESRIKNLDSIRDKKTKYENKREEGKIPINKCFNDILGFRVIIDSNLYEDLIGYLEEYSEKLGYKTFFRDSSKGDYKAYHFYSNVDNNTYPIEIQFWNSEFEHTNKISHKNYKQEYLDIKTNQKIDEEEDDV